MPMTPEVKSWADGLIASGVPAGEVNALVASLEANDKGQEYIRSSQLRQEDYNRQLDKSRKELESKARMVTDKEAELADLQERLTSWKSNADASLSTKAKQIEKLETERTRVLARLNSLRETYAIAEDDLKDLMEAPVVTDKVDNNKPPVGDYLTMEGFQKEATKFAQVYPLLSVELDDLRDEHKELFGNKRPDMKSLMDKAYASGGKKTIRQIWEEEYKVADRRQELAQKAFDDKVNSEVETRLTKRMSEMSLPGGGSTTRKGEGSPVFSLKKTAAPERSEKTQTETSYNRPMDTVMKAVTAHREGKYKDARVV